MLDFIGKLYGDGKEYVTRKEATDVFADQVCHSGLVLHKNLHKIVE
jgi:hypothetical protein